MVSLVGSPTVHAFLQFLNASPTPFHAVNVAVRLLEQKGFKQLREEDDWDVKEGGKYYLTRNQGSLLAFMVPPGWKSGRGLSIVATHVDSPNLKIRPTSKKTTLGYLQVGVETYGSGIWHTWLDRDLSVAGRVVVEEAGSFASKLIKINRPILRIPNLAFHLDRTVNDTFKFNKQTEFIPILGLASSVLNSVKNADAFSSQADQSSKHHPALLSVISKELSVPSENIIDLELSLYDTQAAVLGGVENEFIFSSRLDNLFSSFCAVDALVQASNDAGSNVSCICLFNHEEVGSDSSTGAAGSLLPFLIQRLSPDAAAHAQSVAKSFLISADMGHAVHPSYPDKHEENHRPRINGGIALKVNHNQKYTSDAVGLFFIRKLAERKGIKVQEFVSRNDMSCGSTVGPTLSKIGVRTVDVGNVMLSMHSCREMAGSHDVETSIDLFKTFFDEFAAIDTQLTVG
ncbi:aspartyl aminopeptidase [Hysterangium stoloniferum]|nr:aspartyl aminopeptidase [Hysterangium stoloniferum]